MKKHVIFAIKLPSDTGPYVVSPRGLSRALLHIDELAKPMDEHTGAIQRSPSMRNRMTSANARSKPLFVVMSSSGFNALSKPFARKPLSDAPRTIAATPHHSSTTSKSRGNDNHCGERRAESTVQPKSNRSQTTIASDPSDSTDTQSPGKPAKTAAHKNSWQNGVGSEQQDISSY